ncbi:DNA-binding transcriptional regulator, LysR family [Modicisalibacter muralis]|uniref:DNA-binding transcriptional regulator, LysR family n=1 Tax=Modicisalibacter muralis TaxID=119000 RepID=A0A1G9I378_9GAMM|nr:LysR family transcriptional regulator [Halomonas muralis]SDL19364.1 DNA-binding transcriptional regulator, LysR family [Halomonas muralis]
MHNKILWDDLKTVMAIAEAGSLSGAARWLGVSHATVFRRLGDTESRLGAKLFERSRTGYAPTPAGEDIAASARRIEAEVLGVERRVAGRDLRPSGSVRITTTDTLLAGLLSPIFTAFRRSHPEIFLEIAVSNQLFNLTKREADVAIRPSLAPPEMLVGRRIGTIAQAIYACSNTQIAHDGTAEFSDLDWVGPDERLAYRPLDVWMAGHGVDERCHYRVDTLMGMLAAVRDDIGVAVLPCYLCDGDERLARVGEPIAELATDLWLLTHPDLRRVARIRAFMDFVAQAVKERREQLLGV